MSEQTSITTATPLSVPVAASNVEEFYSPSAPPLAQSTTDARVLVIIPTYNEIANLPVAVQGVRSRYPQVDVLVVDDNSPDGTGDLADQIAAADPQVHVLHRTEKNGLGGAYLAGFAWAKQAGYDYVVEMDADGSHRPEDLGDLLKASEWADLVLGSRWVRGGSTVNWPWHRKLISQAGSFYAGIMLGTGIRDITGGFRVFRVGFLDELDLSSITARGYGFQVEMAYRSHRAGARIIEVPITFVERVHGESKMSFDIVLEAMLLVTRWGVRRLFSPRRR